MIAKRGKQTIWFILTTSLMAWGSEGLFGLVSMTTQFFLADLDSEVTGTIFLSENRKLVSRHGGSDRYYIRYFYFVDDETYVGDIVKYEINIESVEERLESYQDGQTVMVKYDSSFPRWSLLVDGKMSTRMQFQIFLTFLIWPLFMYGIGKFMFDE